MSGNEQPQRPAPKADVAPLPSDVNAVASTTGAPAARSDSKPPSQLTPEEQLALFAKELKENDWGHQPC
jgi:hypothetical protein